MITDPPPDRIQWHEGMLLSPQHFQQEAARVDALVAWHTLASSPYSWGIRKLELDQSLLVAGVVRVLELEAVLPDGMFVALSANDPYSSQLELDLTALEEAPGLDGVSVHLSVGRSRSVRDLGVPTRFVGLSKLPVEDEVSDALPIDIPRLRPNLKLFASKIPPSTFISMKLMTVRKGNEVYSLGQFIPACFDLAIDNPVRQRASALAAQLRNKAAFLAKQSSFPASRFEDRLSNLEQKFRLSSLVGVLPVLEAMLRSPRLNPYALYLALCGLLGPLSLLRPGAVPLQSPPWNHADPLSAFEAVFGSLEELSGDVSQDWSARLFSYDGSVFSIDLSQELTNTRIILGLRGLSEQDLVSWMNGALIGTRGVWTALSERRVLGAARRRIDDAPEFGIRSGSGYILFAVEINDQFILADQDLVINNLAVLPSIQRSIEIVLFAKG